MTRRKAVPETVAHVRPHECGFPLDQCNRTLVACVDAESATVSFLPVDDDLPSVHVTEDSFGGYESVGFRYDTSVQ